MMIDDASLPHAILLEDLNDTDVLFDKVYRQRVLQAFEYFEMPFAYIPSFALLGLTSIKQAIFSLSCIIFLAARKNSEGTWGRLSANGFAA